MDTVRTRLKTRQRTFLKEWRIFHGLTQEQAAERLGIDQSTLSRIERGVAQYDQDFLEQAAHAYNCEVADILIRNPLKPDAVWTVADNLRKATPEQRNLAAEVLNTLLKKHG